ncbi:hypothetical protein MJT46_005194 [Ovis ammon polii x Ovis aries]|nr:hypothetical protein MJT46_005194 [Ovis ammon polii x Ovis aries]
MTKRCVLWRRLQVLEAEKAEHGLCTRRRPTVLKLLSLHFQCSAQKLTRSSRLRPTTLKTSKSFCLLDYEDEEEEDDRVRMALFSPCDPRGPAMRGPDLLRTSPGLGSCSEKASLF